MSILEDIDIVKKHIDDTYTQSSRYYFPRNRLGGYSEVYMFTNEQIKEYLHYMDVKNNQKALSVLASGDQPFNLVAKGVLDIDTFDKNKFTEYYALGLKRTIIANYNYQEFMDIYKIIRSISSRNSDVMEIINDLLPKMDLKYRVFWRAISNHYNKLTKGKDLICSNLFGLLLIGRKDGAESALGSLYLENEEEYNNFKKNLINANITFKQANAYNLIEEFKGKYDYLLLSNILDYFHQVLGLNWNPNDLDKYIKSLESIMQDGGIMFLHYCFGIGSMLVSGTNIEKEDFRDCELIYLSNQVARDDAMIIKRIKKS